MAASRRRLRSLAGVAAAAAAAGLAAACGSDDSGAEGALPVVATTTIVADIVENVGGEDVEVRTLVARDSDAHTFEPEPSDSIAIAEAALVFEVGLGFERWLEDAVEAAGGDAEVVSLSDGVDTIAFEGEEHVDAEEEHAHADDEHADDEQAEDGHAEEADHAGEDQHADAAEHAEEAEHTHEGADPHVWMTAANGALMAETVAGALAGADPDHADAYHERAAAYVTTLEQTADEIEAVLAFQPEEQRVLFTNHDAFGYFAAEHGFEVLGSALRSLTTEGADPSAAEVAALVREIEESGVPVIFPENVANADTLQTIADEAGVEVGPELSTGALGEEGSDADTYVGLLQSNAEIIAASLGGR